MQGHFIISYLCRKLGLFSKNGALISFLVKNATKSLPFVKAILMQPPYPHMNRWFWIPPNQPGPKGRIGTYLRAIENGIAMKRRKSILLKGLTLSLITLFLSTNVVFAYVSEANFWSERQKHRVQNNESDGDLILASLPISPPILSSIRGTKNPISNQNSSALLKKLAPPELHSYLTPIINSLPLIMVPYGK